MAPDGFVRMAPGRHGLASGVLDQEVVHGSGRQSFHQSLPGRPMSEWATAHLREQGGHHQRRHSLIWASTLLLPLALARISLLPSGPMPDRPELPRIERGRCYVWALRPIASGLFLALPRVRGSLRQLRRGAARPIRLCGLLCCTRCLAMPEQTAIQAVGSSTSGSPWESSTRYGEELHGEAYRRSGTIHRSSYLRSPRPSPGGRLLVVGRTTVLGCIPMISSWRGSCPCPLPAPSAPAPSLLVPFAAGGGRSPGGCLQSLSALVRLLLPRLLQRMLRYMRLETLCIQHCILLLEERNLL